MIKTLLVAALLLAATTIAVMAETAGPHLSGGGEDTSVAHGGAPMGVIVGGSVRLGGGGDNRNHGYGALRPKQGRDAALVGCGADTEVVH